MSNPSRFPSPARLALMVVAAIAAAVILKMLHTRYIAASVPSTVPTPLPLNAGAASGAAAGGAAATRWVCVPGPTRFDSAFEATALMLLPWSKDESYRELARRALCVEDYAVFGQATALIGDLIERDDSWFDGVDFALAIRKHTLARSFVDKIEQPALRDEAHRRVVAAVTGTQ